MLGLVVLIISLLIIIDIIIVISREQNLTDIVLKVSTNHGPELPLDAREGKLIKSLGHKPYTVFRIFVRDKRTFSRIFLRRFFGIVFFYY